MSDQERQPTGAGRGGSNQSEQERQIRNQQKSEFERLVKPNDDSKSDEAKKEDIKSRINASEIEESSTSARQDLDSRIQSIDPAQLEQSIQTLKENPPGSLEDSKSLKRKLINTEVLVKETLKLFKRPKLIPAPVDTIGGKLIRVITAKIDNPDAEINNLAAPYIYRLIHASINNQIGSQEQLINLYNEIVNLQYVEENLFNKVREGFIRVAMSEFRGITERDAEDMFRVSKEKKFEEIEINALQDLRRQNPEFDRLISRYVSEEQKELLTAVLSERYFENYVAKQAVKILELTGNSEDPNTFTVNKLKVVPEEKYKELSRTLKNNIINLVGTLFSAIDESEPKETWEAASSRGGLWYSVDTLSQTLTARLETLRRRPFEPGTIMRKLLFFKQDQEYKNWDMPAKEPFDIASEPKEEKAQHAHQMKRVVTPKWIDIKTNANDFLLSAYNAALEEIGIRKIMHNARALLLHPPPGEQEGGYWGRMAGYVKSFLPGKELDFLWTLPDAEDILAASQLLDKFRETEFSMYDWIHQTTTTESASDMLTEVQRSALDYLRRLSPELWEDEQRAKRALLMGIGDGYCFSLKEIENGAWADAPLFEGKYTYWSYGHQSAAPYQAFNFLAHTSLRFQNERFLTGNLLFMPIMGDFAEKGNMRLWNHKMLLEQMEKSINSFTHGKYQSDVNKGIIRFIDLINVGKVGSIYTRSGWRPWAVIEGMMDRIQASDSRSEGGKRKVDILNSWKALENVGIELLRSLVGQIERYDADFYQEGGLTRRRALAQYLYGRYFPKEASETDFSRFFNSLEKDKEGKLLGKDDLAKKYKTFYYRVFTRAIVQRIPTKFVRLGTERTRFIAGRKRMWEIIKEKTKLGDEELQKTMRDLCSTEVKLRRETSQKLKDGIYKEGKQLYEIDSSTVDYELTEEKIERYMKDILGKGAADLTERVSKAKKVYGAIKEYLDKDDPAYLDDFAKKYEGVDAPSPETFPFAIAVEELDRSLIPQRGSGEDTEGRAIADIQSTEANVSKVISDYFSKIRGVSVAGKNDYMTLINEIKKVKDTIEGIIGLDYAEKISHYLGAFTIQFFKKDTLARALGGNILKAGERTSIAAEFAGAGRGVWEWGAAEINTFITLLEQQQVLYKDPINRNIDAVPNYEKVPVEINLFGKKIKLGEYTKRKRDYEYYGGRLRKEFGGGWKDIAFDMTVQYLPLLTILLLIKYIKDAFEEAEGKKKK